ncbi:acyl-CoA carboxylase epsilon subunit [Nocardioides sp. GCM10028917]|uniref:acyl-CoA carboxylase epsilon subunit n=1 Tax=Nocardioides sp. GCM10028917 TaxID=3273408 RepID=UPI0036197615
MTDEQETARDEPAAPVLRIVNADATPEEVAALVAVFAALGSGGGGAPKRPRPAWSNPARGVRRTHRHGPDAWRASGLPR